MSNWFRHAQDIGAVEFVNPKLARLKRRREGLAWGLFLLVVGVVLGTSGDSLGVFMFFLLLAGASAASGFVE